MKMYVKDSFANQILTYLKETSENLLDASITIVFNPKKLMRGTGLYRNYNAHPLYHKSISNLKRSPYFTHKKETFYLSPAGRIKIIKDIVSDKKENKAWDKKWRTVIFDIPESSRRERNFLRRELRWMGFKELQHSIWVTPYNIEKELLALLTLWQKDFRGDIRILVAEKITNDGDFKKMFNLKE